MLAQADLIDELEAPETLIDPPKGSERPLVLLDPDHPGFRDQAYRARRNAIAHIALEHRTGERVPSAPYTPEEDHLWQQICEALETGHREHACAEYLACIDRLGLSRDKVPQLCEVSDRLAEISGFRLEPVAGLVEAYVFLEALADNILLSTQYIRHYSTPLYTPEPDIVHETIGHAVTLADPRLAELNRMFGRAARKTSSEGEMKRLANIYWFTIEFGVVRERGEIKCYGAGLVSSAGEMSAMHQAKLMPFDLELMTQVEIDPTNFQPVLFCADSFDAMYDALREFLATRC
jgi:phenylalanine-4-hydroxylase